LTLNRSLGVSGKAGKQLKSLVTHIRLREWGVEFRERGFQCSNLKIVIPNDDQDEIEEEEEVALSIDKLSANWTSYRQPIIDVEFSDTKINIKLEEIVKLRKPRSNWHRLKKSGFPPAFSDSKQPKSTPKTGAIRLRQIRCNDVCSVALSMTIFGRSISSTDLGLPDISIPGELITDVWTLAVAEYGEGEESVEASDALEALSRIFLKLLLDELEALVIGDRGPLVDAFLGALKSALETALSRIDGHVSDVEQTVEAVLAEYSESRH